MRFRPFVLALTSLLAAGTAVAEESTPRAKPEVRARSAGSTAERSTARRSAARGSGGRAWWAQPGDRGWLGVRLSTQAEAQHAWRAEEIPDAWFDVLNLEWLAEDWDGEGVLVLQVFPDTPAERAGLLPGDVITSFNGIRTASPGVLVFVVQRVVVGYDANIDVLRDGETRTVLVEIGMHPEDARRLEEEKEAERLAADDGDEEEP